MFPISRDPPEGGTTQTTRYRQNFTNSFQFLGIPPKGEHAYNTRGIIWFWQTCFQFLGIPPKGELPGPFKARTGNVPGSFQFLGIPPKGELEAHD